MLSDFIKHKEKELLERKAQIPLEELKSKIEDMCDSRSFKNALRKNCIALIAEIKKRSPSEGLIKENFDPVDVAKEYESGGAAVVSVLTDEKFFSGNIDIMPQVRAATSIPILRKDFIIDSYQLYESKAFGADAVLLIAAALSKDKLIELIKIAENLNMECLVEVHTKEELKKLPSDTEIIGINNRDLNTLKTDLSVTVDLIKEIPKNKIIVSESGINSREDVLLLLKSGINAILIGTSLMKADNIKNKIKELTLDGQKQLQYKNLGTNREITSRLLTDIYPRTNLG